MTKQGYLVLTFVLSVALLLKHVLVPLNPDNDTYQAMAWQLYGYGRIPYLGSWDQNFPGIVYLHWLSMVLFGNSDVGFRTLDILFHLGSSLLLFHITRRWLEEKVALTASVLYCLYYISDSFWLAGQRDGFAVFFVLLALAWSLQIREGSQSRALAVGIGLAIAAASLIRPTFLIFSLPLVFVYWRRPDRWNTTAIAAACVLLVWVLQFIPYILIQGGLREYYLATIQFTLDLYGGVQQPWSNLLLWNRAQRIFFTILFIGVLLLIGRRVRLGDDPFVARLLLMLLACSLLPVILMRKFSLYHYDPFFTLLAPLCAWILWRTAETLYPRTPVIIMIVLMAIIFIRLYPRHIVKDYMQGGGPANPQALHYVHNRIHHDTLYGAAPMRELSSYIRERTGPSDPIEFATIWPAAQWQAERRQASRFTTFYALAMEAGGRQQPYQREWQHEFLDSLRRVRPRVMVVAKGPRTFLLDSLKEPYFKIRELPGFQELLAERYRLDTSFRGFDCYVLK